MKMKMKMFLDEDPGGTILYLKPILSELRHVKPPKCSEWSPQTYTANEARPVFPMRNQIEQFFRKCRCYSTGSIQKISRTRSTGLTYPTRSVYISAVRTLEDSSSFG